MLKVEKVLMLLCEWCVKMMMRTLLNFEFPALFGMYNFVPYFHQKCQNVDRLVNTYVGNNFLNDSNITTTTKHKRRPTQKNSSIRFITQVDLFQIQFNLFGSTSEQRIEESCKGIPALKFSSLIFEKF